MSFNLISVTQAAVSGYVTRLEGLNCTICKHRTDEVALKLKRTGRSYRTMVTTRKDQLLEAQVTSDNHNMLLHRQLGHLATDRIRQVVSYESGADGPQKNNVHIEDVCVGCDGGKMVNRSFKPLKKSHRVDARLQLVHNNVYGPLLVKSIGQTRYFLTYFDNYARMSFVHFLNIKSELYRRMRNFVEFVETKTEENVKHLCKYSGGMYNSQALVNYLKQR